MTSIFSDAAQKSAKPADNWPDFKQPIPPPLKIAYNEIWVANYERFTNRTETDGASEEDSNITFVQLVHPWIYRAIWL